MVLFAVIHELNIDVLHASQNKMRKSDERSLNDVNMHFNPLTLF